MDRSDSHSRSRASHRAKPSPTSRGQDWMPEAVRHLFEIATKRG